MAKIYNPFEIDVILRRELFRDVGLTAFEILRNLILRSPVGDPENWQNPDSAPEGYVGGHFRRNWLVSIGIEEITELAGAEEPIAFTLGRGRNRIRAFEAGQASRLIIQNNAPYASKLAEGHSLQAEAGWVDESIDLALLFPPGIEELP